MNDRQTLRIPSWIRGFHVYKDWWTPTCGEILPLQPKPENAEDKNAVAVLKESRVICHIPYHLANTKDCTGIITHFISKPTNRGSVEVSGKAVNRGGGLGMEIPCVYNFDGPSKHVNLLQQLIDVGNNPAVCTEVDADSGKQRRPKRKIQAMMAAKEKKVNFLHASKNLFQRTWVKVFTEYYFQELKKSNFATALLRKLHSHAKICHYICLHKLRG